jgi:glycosyltransferase involved in cell wall biosynthesis
MKNQKVSVIVIAKNEEKKIEDCLKSVAWADEVVVIDNGSTDKTAEIAKANNAKVTTFKGGTYATRKNKGAKEASGDWLFYVDADERATPEIEKEVRKKILSDKHSVYAVPRRNIILGREMKHGGWWPDYVKHLVRKELLTEWKGDLHEEPVYEGDLGYLENPLIHIKHDNLSEMVEKSNEWSEVEAKLLFESRHPKMAWWRFIRIMITELWYRLIRMRGFMDGAEGVIYAFYQSWYRFLVYAKLWELQLKTQNANVKTQNLKYNG